MRRTLAALALIFLALTATACSTVSDEPAAPASSPAASGPELTGELTIYAAASLKASFDELATLFEERHPSLHVLPIVYDGSSVLVTQLAEGAPADVFASADEKNMDRAVDAGLTADEPALFASNTLVIATPAGNPGTVDGLDDLADPSRIVVLCAVEVPCGAASARLLDQAGVVVTPASLEQNVTAVLTKVAADEADAGLVYATDVQGRDDVESIVPEGASDVVNRYPAAALAAAENPDAAAAFVAFILSDEGQAVLASSGFGAP